MDKIKVCFIIGHTRFPERGGYENLVYDLTQALSDKADVHVVCSKVNHEIPFSDNIKVHPILTPITDIKFLKYPVNTFTHQIRFLFLSYKEKFDVINAHPAYPSGLIAYFSKFLGIPIVCTSHGADIQIDAGIGYGTRLNKVHSWLTRLTLKAADVHTLVSKSMIKDAIDAGSDPSKIQVIYNGIDVDKIPNKSGSCITKYGINGEDFMILFLGRLHPKKCPDDLVKAMPIILKYVKNAKLIFAGHGEELEKLENIVNQLDLRDHVFFTGFVSEDDKWCLLKRCDVFALPSLVEAFGITVIEAMACSKPVIATNLGSFPEIITDNITGYLVSPNSPEELADKTIKIAFDKIKRKNIGQNAKREVEIRFNINKISKDYMNMYKSLL